MSRAKENYLPVHDPFYKLGGYTVSNLGTIKNKMGRILKGHRRPDGYCRVTLSYSGCQDGFYVHHLVARAHIGPPKSLLHQFNHKDRNPENNRADNLEWVTPSENIRHAYSNEHHGKRRFTDAEWQEMFELRERGLTFQAIGNRFGCSKQRVWGICSNQQRKESC